MRTGIIFGDDFRAKVTVKVGVEKEVLDRLFLECEGE